MAPVTSSGGEPSGSYWWRAGSGAQFYGGLYLQVVHFHEIQISNQFLAIVFHINGLRRTVVQAAEAKLAAIPIDAEIDQIDGIYRTGVRAVAASNTCIRDDVVLIDEFFRPVDGIEPCDHLPHVHRFTKLAPLSLFHSPDGIPGEFANALIRRRIGQMPGGPGMFLHLVARPDGRKAAHVHKGVERHRDTPLVRQPLDNGTGRIVLIALRPAEGHVGRHRHSGYGGQACQPSFHVFGCIIVEDRRSNDHQLMLVQDVDIDTLELSGGDPYPTRFKGLGNEPAMSPCVTGLTVPGHHGPVQGTGFQGMLGNDFVTAAVARQNGHGCRQCSGGTFSKEGSSIFHSPWPFAKTYKEDRLTVTNRGRHCQIKGLMA